MRAYQDGGKDRKGRPGSREKEIGFERERERERRGRERREREREGERENPIVACRQSVSRLQFRPDTRQPKPFR